MEYRFDDYFTKTKVRKHVGRYKSKRERLFEEEPESLPLAFLLNHHLHFRCLISQFSLDTADKPDFAYLTKSSTKWHFVIVEIKTPSKLLFRSKRSSGILVQSADLTEALSQINTYREFIKRNTSEVLRRIEPIRKPLGSNGVKFRYVLVIGRDKAIEYDRALRDRLVTLENEDLKIFTWDSVLRYCNETRPEQRINILSQVREGFQFKRLHGPPTNMLAYVGPADLTLDKEQENYLAGEEYDISSWKKGGLLTNGGMKPSEEVENQMKVNRYLAEVHKGEQPVRVLQHNIIHELENCHDGALEKWLEVITNHGLDNGIDYHISNSPLLAENMLPHVRGTKISISETFLSYLWCMCYCLIVVADEGMNKTAQGMTPRPEYLQRAEKLFHYAMSLKKVFSEWDKNLPNPELYDPDQDEYIEKVNGILLYATIFALAHEIGHVALGHTSTEPSAMKDSKQDETAADEYAAEVLQEASLVSSKRSTVITGGITSVSALLLLDEDIESRTHPDADQRIRSVFEVFDLEDENPTWFQACAAYWCWNIAYNKGPRFLDSYDTPRQFFEKLNHEAHIAS